MTNGELFKKIFGIYAGEVWAFTTERFLSWAEKEVRGNVLVGKCESCNNDVYENENDFCRE